MKRSKRTRDEWRVGKLKKNAIGICSEAGRRDVILHGRPEARRYDNQGKVEKTENSEEKSGRSWQKLHKVA